jgi:hypothetical protein
MNGLPVFELTDQLRRAAFVERICIRNLAGWFLVVPAYETKYQVAYAAWGHAEHVNWLRDRLAHLRGGHADASIDPRLVTFMDQVKDSPDAWAFLRSTYEVIYPALLSLYRALLDEADPSANAFDVRLLRRLIPEIEAMVESAGEVLDADPDPDASQHWAAGLKARLESLGGLSGRAASTAAMGDPDGRSLFVLPRTIVFDDRIQDLPLLSYEDRSALTYEQSIQEQFKVFFNEVYAASMLATVIFDAYQAGIDWQLVFGLTRHFWDEARHSEFGALRLSELGMEPDRCDQSLFRNGLHMPLLHRICYLTMVLEPYYMPRKKPRFEEYAEAGDARSQLFADHDWSDEINHVRFGKDALEALLMNDARDVKRLKEEVIEILEEHVGDAVTGLSPF